MSFGAGSYPEPKDPPKENTELIEDIKTLTEIRNRLEGDDETNLDAVHALARKHDYDTGAVIDDFEDGNAGLDEAVEAIENFILHLEAKKVVM